MSYKSRRVRRSQRNKHEDEGHERWLVSYADFITLLFAFFVILYATSSKNTEKEKQFEESVREHLARVGAGVGIAVGGNDSQGAKEGLNKSPLDSLLTNPLDKYDIQDPGVSSLLKKIEIFVEENFSAEEITQFFQDIHANEKGVRLVLYGKEFFNGSSAELNENSLYVIDKLSEVLKTEPVRIIVESHISENLNLKNSNTSHWELGAVRSTKVSSYLVEKLNFVADNLIPISYGKIRPRFSAKEEGPKQKNSRLTLFIVDAEVEL